LSSKKRKLSKCVVWKRRKPKSFGGSRLVIFGYSLRNTPCISRFSALTRSVGYGSVWCCAFVVIIFTKTACLLKSFQFLEVCFISSKMTRFISRPLGIQLPLLLAPPYNEAQGYLAWCIPRPRAHHNQLAFFLPYTYAAAIGGSPIVSLRPTPALPRRTRKRKPSADSGIYVQDIASCGRSFWILIHTCNTEPHGGNIS
jgi:hypothetical protein